MSEVWPLDVRLSFEQSAVNRLRPFKCLLLMPFERRFDIVAKEIGNCVKVVTAPNPEFPDQADSRVDRLDWVTSSGVIHNELWNEMAGADIIFCDITGYNPNVMFEGGVAAAWKRMHQVIFIRDRFFKQQSPFDIAPIRYTEYELTSDGLPAFRDKIIKLVGDAYISFPDSLIGSTPPILPATIDFAADHDDSRIYTPPLAHRRVMNSTLEFGSTLFFPQSWASLGNAQVTNLDLEFDGAFRNPISDGAWIGVAVRSQHFYANYSHLLYLKRDGSIVLTQPDESPPNFYSDQVLRQPTIIEDASFHRFHVRFDERTLFVAIDDFKQPFEVSRLPRVFGPGLIRFQSSLTWMALKNIRVNAI